MFILGTRVDNLTKAEVLAKIQQLLLSNETGKQLVTTNPEFILAAQKDEEFRQIINDSWLSIADGYGIRLAAKYLDLTQESGAGSREPANFFSRFWLPASNFLLGMKVALWGALKKDKKLDIIKETITGTDLVGEICKVLRDKRQETRIFLLGGYGDTPKIVAEKLLQQFNNLTIDCSVFEAENIIEKINSFQPAILFVALNHPKAQTWIDENLPKMPSVKLAVGVGGAFDYLSGKIKRAPESWRSNGFEWLYRLLHQPKRLKRIWQASASFPWKVFTNTV
jgi:N-acetylglucosaminyldiphosphoundecaprenol N-acetyl-beta-D-mannosaminyltransferase